MTIVGSAAPALDRRAFIQAITAAITALQVGGCSRPSGGSTAGARPVDGAIVDGAIWDVLRKALDSLKASPDHLLARSNAAVATKDARKIAEFVRDSITILPSTTGGSAVGDNLWGVRATLRGGAGSARDRADVLARLLTRAGFQTSVVSMARPASLTAAILYRARVLHFAPDMRLLEPLLARRLRPVAISNEPDDETARQISEVADALMASLGPAELARMTPVDAKLPDYLPIVEYARGGQKAWATAYGSTDVVLEPPPGLAGRAGDSQAKRVSVAVSVAVNPPRDSVVDRTVPREILRGDWPLEAVAGRQLMVGFIPPGDPRPYLRGADPALALQRIPVMRLLSTEPLEDKNIPVIVTGNRIGLDGQVHEEVSRTGVAAGDTSAPAPSTSGALAPQSGRVNDVTQLQLSVAAGAFPNIDVDVAIADAKGKAVDRLTAADLKLTEDGKPQAFSIMRNAVPEGIRILVLYDTSGSITESWGTAAARATFEATFADQLVASAKIAPYLVQVIGLNGTPTPSSWVAPDAQQLRATMQSTASLSDVWRSLGETANRSGASAVIMLSDFVSSLELPDQVVRFQRNLKGSNLPLALVPIGVRDSAAISLVHKLAKCEEFSQKDPELSRKLGQFIARQVKQAASLNYRLRYRADARGANLRHLTLSPTGRSNPVASGTYTVPPEADRVAPSGIAGVYLRIEVAGRATTRRLGGVAINYRGTVDDTADQSAIDEATSVLNGAHTITFDAAQPTTSAILFEALNRMLTFEQVSKAPNAPADTVLGALAKVLPMDALPGLLLEPAPSPGTNFESVVPDGIRVIVSSDLSSKNAVERKVDVVPEFNVWHGLDSDPRRRLVATMRRSLATSMRERQWLTNSAARRLTAAKWVALPPFVAAESQNKVNAQQLRAVGPLLQQYSSYVRIVPGEGDATAFWIVDPATGSVVAIDRDGRGGGSWGVPKCGGLSNDTALPFALILLGVFCFAESPAPGGTAWQFCVGADTYSATATAVESFDNPVSVTAVSTLLYGIQLGAGTQLEDPAKYGARMLVAVIIAMMSAWTLFCPAN